MFVCDLPAVQAAFHLQSAALLLQKEVLSMQIPIVFFIHGLVSRYYFLLFLQTTKSVVRWTIQEF